ncbi:MAG: hypothetical protein JWQ33_1220 [Ramlibacter sp.]|nr:hypothetical protein [Ramlibacter sp.]
MIRGLPSRRPFPLLRSFAFAALLSGCVFAPAPPAVRTGPSAAARAPRPAGPVDPEITSDCGISHLRDSVLKRINAARAAARSCGARHMQAARPLVWDRALAEAAEQHSVDMAARRYFDHVSPDGKRVSQRVSAQGYRWRLVGENLAGGDTTVAGVIAGWLGSPEHCENLMGQAYAEVGVSCVRQPGSQWGTYWTMVLATRR